MGGWILLGCKVVGAMHLAHLVGKEVGKEVDKVGE